MTHVKYLKNNNIDLGMKKHCEIVIRSLMSWHMSCHDKLPTNSERRGFQEPVNKISRKWKRPSVDAPPAYMSLSILPYWRYLMSWRHSATSPDVMTSFWESANELTDRRTGGQTERGKDTRKHGTDSITSTTDAGGNQSPKPREWVP